jgi:hypothetical protein
MAAADLRFVGFAGPAAAKGSKLRYPLRSASRGKVEPAAAADAPPSGSVPRRYFFDNLQTLRFFYCSVEFTRL